MTVRTLCVDICGIITGQQSLNKYFKLAFLVQYLDNFAFTYIMEAGGEQMTPVNGLVSEDWPGRWNHVTKLLERRGPFTHPNFDPSPGMLHFLRESCKVHHVNTQHHTSYKL